MKSIKKSKPQPFKEQLMVRKYDRTTSKDLPPFHEVINSLDEVSDGEMVAVYRLERVWRVKKNITTIDLPKSSRA